MLPAVAFFCGQGCVFPPDVFCLLIWFGSVFGARSVRGYSIHTLSKQMTPESRRGSVLVLPWIARIGAGCFHLLKLRLEMRCFLFELLFLGNSKKVTQSWVHLYEISGEH